MRLGSARVGWVLLVSYHSWLLSILSANLFLTEWPPPEVVTALRAGGQAALAVAASKVVTFMVGEETENKMLFEKGLQTY